MPTLSKKVSNKIKKHITPRSQIKSALRRLWLKSRERNFSLQRDNYTCQACGSKQSRAKGKEVYVEVHHDHGIGRWSAVIDLIYQEILCHPDGMTTLCKHCHESEHGKEG